MPVDEKKKEDIGKETKRILDKFSRALAKIGFKETNVERDADRRDEGRGRACDAEFRKIMLENAPRHDEDFIKAEKKTW